MSIISTPPFSLEIFSMIFMSGIIRLALNFKPGDLGLSGSINLSVNVLSVVMDSRLFFVSDYLNGKYIENIADYDCINGPKLPVIRKMLVSDFIDSGMCDSGDVIDPHHANAGGTVVTTAGVRVGSIRSLRQKSVRAGFGEAVGAPFRRRLRLTIQDVTDSRLVQGVQAPLRADGHRATSFP